MKSTSLLSRPSLIAAALSIAPTLAHAHPGHDHVSGFSQGLAHPVLGMDHVLAMVAVGLWAVQLGGRALWLIPASFVGVMALGSAAGMAGIALPGMEQGILASVLILGVLIAAAARLPVWASAAIVGLFAVFHGVAHGAETPATANGLAYTLGFAISTAALHLSGIAAGMMLRNVARAQLIRATGGVIALAAVLLYFGAI